MAQKGCPLLLPALLSLFLLSAAARAKPGSQTKSQPGTVTASAISQPESVQRLRRQWEQEPASVSKARALIDAYLRVRNPDAALSVAARVLQQNPGNTEMHVRRAMAYMQPHDHKAALAELDKVISDPKKPDPSIIKLRGDCHLGLGQYKLAIADFETLTKLSPHNAYGFDKLGAAHIAIRQWDAAIQAYSKAIRINPDPMFYHARAICYQHQGKLDEAIKDMEAGSHGPAKDLDRTTFLCELYLKKGNWEKVMDCATAGLALEPEAYTLLTKRAEAYEHLGKNDLAARDRKKAAACFAEFGSWGAPLPSDKKPSAKK